MADSSVYQERVHAICKSVVDEWLSDDHKTDKPDLRIVDFLRSEGALFVVPSTTMWQPHTVVVTPRCATLLILSGSSFYSVPFYHFHQPLNDRQLRLLDSVYQTEWLTSSSSISPVNEQFSHVLRTYIPGDAYIGDGVYRRYIPTSALFVITWDAVDENELQVVNLLSNHILDEIGNPL